MAWGAWAVLLVLASALGALYVEAGPPDQVMFGALVLLWNLGLVTTHQAFAGFSNTSVITIGCLFVVARAVDRSKVVDRATRGLLGQRTSERGAVVRLCATGMVLSGFLNNTPLVALLMPIVRDWARKRGFAASKFLIPLSYSTIMGGLLTVIGSSTNLVVNGLLEQSGVEPFSFFEPALVALPVGLFAFAYLVCVVPGLLPGDRGGLFRALREGKKDLVTELELTAGFPLLGANVFEALDSLGVQRDALVKILRRGPASPDATARSKAEEERRVSWDFAAAERAVEEDPAEPFVRNLSAWGDEETEAEAQTAGRTPIFPVPPHELALEGDVLVLSLGQEELTDLIGTRPQGLQVQSLHPRELAGDDSFVEVVLAPECPVVGCHLSQGSHEFRDRYGVALIAVRTRQLAADEAPRTRTRTYSTVAAGGEVVGLGMAGQASTGKLRVSRSSVPSRRRSVSEGNFFAQRSGRLARATEMLWKRAPELGGLGDFEGEEEPESTFTAGDIALLLVPTKVELPTSDFLLMTRIAGLPPPATRADLAPLAAFCLGLALTVFANVSMVRVAATLSVFCVLGGWVRPRELREAVDWHLLILIGSALGLAQAVQSSGLSQAGAAAVQAAGLPPRGALVLLFLLVMCVTELVTNNAAAALGLPLAVSLAKELGLASPRPFAMAVMLAASTSYTCPIGYATNLMVLGPGGYTFADFLRVGLLMDVIYWVGCSLVLPLVWPLA